MTDYEQIERLSEALFISREEVQKQREEIKRLRAALHAIAACDVRDDMDVAMEIAREALGDE